MTINELPSRIINYEGREYLFFSGTSYLGLAQNRQMQALLTEGVARYGLHFGASRNGNLQLAALNTIRSELYSFDWIAQLPDDQPIFLVVDDSHGLGVLNGGCGSWPGLAKKLAHKPNVRLIVTASLAKAMGLPGGVIVSDPDTLAAIRKTAYFGACSPMPPAYAHAYTRADALCELAHEKLMQNITLAEQLLPLGMFSHAPGYPVFYTDHDELYPHLLEKGIFVYSFAYPTPAHKANTRIVISAFHEPEDIEKLAAAVRLFAHNHSHARAAYSAQPGQNG